MIGVTTEEAKEAATELLLSRDFRSLGSADRARVMTLLSYITTAEAAQQREKVKAATFLRASECCGDFSTCALPCRQAAEMRYRNRLSYRDEIGAAGRENLDALDVLALQEGHAVLIHEIDFKHLWDKMLGAALSEVKV